jgi:hypothetical protein
MTRPLNSLASQPIRTEPNTTDYEWAGSTLRHLLNLQQPAAELWPFFSGPKRAAKIVGSGHPPLTMEELVKRQPEILGPAGADPEHHGQKYFFVKFLDPSDFPAFAYVGFRPEAVQALRLDAPAFKRHVAELLWQDRQSSEGLAGLAGPQIRSRQLFEQFKQAYKGWAVEEAADNWSGSTSRAFIDPFVLAPNRRAAQDRLAAQADVRRRIVGLMHRIDFEPDQAILIETPTLHAIAGLSLQIHPRTPENFFPKDELWIYKKIELPGPRQGWILVEPQRTFDKTESGGDFFTPFAWTAVGGKEGLGFRKAISRDYLDAFVSLMDATPHPASHYVRKAQRAAFPGGSTQGSAQWHRLVEEAGWPYFLVRELRFAGAGESTTPLTRDCFAELHATQGSIEATLRGGGSTVHRFTVSPTQPAFLPATLPFETITYTAAAPATLLYFTRSKSHR